MENVSQSSGNDEEAQLKRAQEEQMRRDLMATVLEPAARERLSRIALVGPERSGQIETILLRMVQSGQIRGKVSESQLINLLEQMEDSKGNKSAQKPTIVFHRRKGLDDDDDFDI